MEREADVVIVGAGIVGCATAHYLARRGVRVAVVERAARAGERFFLPNYWRNKALFRFHVGRPLLRSLAAALPGTTARRQPLVWDRAFDPVPNPHKVRRGLAELQRVLPGLPPLEIARSWAGYIDATPDLVPVLGVAPGVPGFVLATGFSGHGFAMGPIAGRLVSELIVDGKTSLDISGFRFSRFAEGAIGKPRSVL